MRRCRALYANAEVEEAVDSYLCACRGRNDDCFRERADRSGKDAMAFREAMIRSCNNFSKLQEGL